MSGEHSTRSHENIPHSHKTSESSIRLWLEKGGLSIFMSTFRWLFMLNSCRVSGESTEFVYNAHERRWGERWDWIHPGTNSWRWKEPGSFVILCMQTWCHIKSKMRSLSRMSLGTLTGCQVCAPPTTFCVHEKDGSHIHVTNFKYMSQVPPGRSKYSACIFFSHSIICRFVWCNKLIQWFWVKKTSH